MAVIPTQTQTANPNESVRMRRAKSVSLSLILRYALLIFLSIVFLIPFYLLLRNGLASDQEITSQQWTFFPHVLHFDNIGELFSDESVPFANSLLISALVAISTTVGSILIAMLAGYGLARVQYRWSGIVFGAILATLVLPTAATFVPSFEIVAALGWVGTVYGLIVPGLFAGFTTFLFRQFFLSFPQELEDAGRVDGLHDWGIFWRLAVPNSLPIIAALSVVTFIAAWNGFLWPLVIVGQQDTAWTVQIAISTFLTAQTINIHELFLASLIAILPLVVLFIFLQRYIVEGYTQSGLKG